MAKLMTIDIVTPEKRIFEGKITELTAPGTDGEFGILPEHAPFATAIEPGVVTIPPARRDATAAEMLVEQLRLLERATAQRLAVLAESAETALAANGTFLTERFGALETLPEGPSAE